MNILQKAAGVGITPANFNCWVAQKFLYGAGYLVGAISLRLKAALFGIELGKNVSAYGPVGLIRWPGGRIRIGDNVAIISSSRRSTASALAFPTRLRVFGKGAFIDIGPGCQLSGASITARSCAITLGRQVMLGPNCVIVDSDFHAPWPAEQRAHEPGMDRDRPVLIEDYVWIGLNCVILKGVTIGRGSLVGAGSVVTRDIPANAVACGSPCKVVRIVEPQ